ncbi:Major Facilitator Superfamily protein [Penicillium cf. viridicatum]|uniref:Major Facilitator Superfamily protein n=1 Tax=Penicillium cf. viridicatum TaxID=2972119 RepID=A0A9W9M2P7_9EURO|nr:Major Facilitator Superfamily protein [Penicillium cf. viridicatum]
MALTWGGTAYSWSNWRIIICLVLGFVGMVIFHVYEASPWCPEPMMPPHIFGNRTSFAALILSFIHNMLTFWVVYFIPVYFQSVKLSTSTRAGVQFLPRVILAVPTAIAGGVVPQAATNLSTSLEWVLPFWGWGYSHSLMLTPVIQNGSFIKLLPPYASVCFSQLPSYAALGFIVISFEKQIKLRTELETEYGIQDAKKEKDSEEAVEAPAPEI